jgi:REP element-mobilizing transposase RayT
MSNDSSSVRDSGPIAYFLTWTTHGSWLPGDQRGWFKRCGDYRPPDESLRVAAARALIGVPVTMTPSQRNAVHHAIHATCSHRRWLLHACQCRTQHVHVVVTATGAKPSLVLDQLKAWATRGLTAAAAPCLARHRWWTRGGSTRLIYGEEGLHRVIAYVVDGQDRPR